MSSAPSSDPGSAPHFKAGSSGTGAVFHHTGLILCCAKQPQLSLEGMRAEVTQHLPEGGVSLGDELRYGFGINVCFMTLGIRA